MAEPNRQEAPCVYTKISVFLTLGSRNKWKQWVQVQRHAPLLNSWFISDAFRAFCYNWMHAELRDSIHLLNGNIQVRGNKRIHQIKANTAANGNGEATWSLGMLLLTPVWTRSSYAVLTIHYPQVDKRAIKNKYFWNCMFKRFNHQVGCLTGIRRIFF